MTDKRGDIDIVSQKLLNMLKTDELLRKSLLMSGTLNDDYDKEIEKLHIKNSKELEEIIDTYGFPTNDQYAKEVVDAAWKIYQHSISRPDFMRKVLNILQKLAEEGKIEKALVAKTIDRIRVFEGKKQIYGTNFDWDENGALNPTPIEDPDNVDKLRMSMGLESISESTLKMRQKAEQDGEKPPKNYKNKKKEFTKWLKRVGWRSTKKDPSLEVREI